VVLLEPFHEVQFRADRPGRARRGLLDLAEDVARRAGEIGLVDHLHRALGMHEDLHARQVRPHRIDVLRLEHRMHAAVALPEDHAALFDLLPRVASERRVVRVPESHLVEWDAHRAGRVAAEVLVGKKEHSLGAGKRPVEYGPGVARRADDAAVATAEGLETRGRVDVGHGRDVGGVDHPAEVGPGVFHLLDRGHVGHRAAGGDVGEHDRHPPAAAGRNLLGPVGQDVGRLGHEVDAAEGDRLAVSPVGR